jgi:hypothetical protein
LTEEAFFQDMIAKTWTISNVQYYTGIRRKSSVCFKITVTFTRLRQTLTTLHIHKSNVLPTQACSNLLV